MPEKKLSFFKIACLFESSLIVLAIILGWIADINPFADLWYSETAIFYGVVGTLPLLLVFAAIYQMRFAAIEKIRQVMMDTIAASLQSLHWVDLLVLASIAGVSEELLFRGVLQPWLEMAWGMTAGLLLSSVLFGLVHAVTPLYAVLAGLVGVYLGLSLDYGGERNLLIPIVIHAVYDFIAFLIVLYYYRREHQS